MNRNNYKLKSTSTSHYTTAISKNGGVEVENFPGLRSDGQGIISGITIQSVQNLAWQVEVQDYDLNVLNRHKFAASDSELIDVNGTMTHVYNINFTEPWNIPLIPKYETTSIGLRNMDTVSDKIAGTSGAVTIILDTRR